VSGLALRELRTAAGQKVPMYLQLIYITSYPRRLLLLHHAIEEHSSSLWSVNVANQYGIYGAIQVNSPFFISMHHSILC
jgi:hypothetical protein